MIQIIIAILASISVVSGTAFVAYEAGQESTENTTQPATATTTEAAALPVPDSVAPDDEATPDEENTAGEPSESTEPEDTSAPTIPLTTASQEEDVEEVPETAPIETGTSTTTSASVGITTTPPTASPTTSTTQNFKESALASITALMDSYSTTTKWIDTGIMPLLSDRERILDGLILNTQGLMASSSDPVVLYVYGLFIDAYNLDKSQVVNFYRDKFSEIRDRMNSEAVSILKTEHEKFSAAPMVGEAEFDALIQSLKQYEDSLESDYTDKVRSTIVEYINQVGSKDELYQRAWAELSVIASSPGNSTQNLEKILNQLRLGQPKPL